MGLEWIAPTIAGAFLLSASVATAVIARRTAHSTSQDTHAPDVTDAWAEADRARTRMHIVEDLFWAIRAAFKGFARRVQSGGSTELTEKEKAALEALPPTTEKEPS